MMKLTILFVFWFQSYGYYFLYISLFADLVEKFETNISRGENEKVLGASDLYTLYFNCDHFNFLYRVCGLFNRRRQLGLIPENEKEKSNFVLACIF